MNLNHLHKQYKNKKIRNKIKKSETSKTTKINNFYNKNSKKRFAFQYKVSRQRTFLECSATHRGATGPDKSPASRFIGVPSPITSKK